MILVNHYAIRPPIPKTSLIQHFRVEIMAFPFVLFHRDRSCNFCCLFPGRQRFSVQTLLKFFTNSSPPATMCTHYSLYKDMTNLSLLAGVCAACMLAYRCLQMKWWAAVTDVAIPSQKALFSNVTIYLSANFQCSNRVVFVPFFIICSLHLIAV